MCQANNLLGLFLSPKVQASHPARDHQAEPEAPDDPVG